MRPSEHGFRTVSSYLHSEEDPATALIGGVSGIVGKTPRPSSNGFTACTKSCSCNESGKFVDRCETCSREWVH